MGEPKLDPFLRRVIEQREREQYIDVAGEADAAREKYLDAQIRLRCSTPGCGIRLHEASAARGDICARCQKRARAQSRPPPDEVAAAIEATRKSVHTAKPAELPAKEAPVAEKTTTCGWEEEPCDEVLDPVRNKSGLCGRHRNIQNMRKRSAEKRNRGGRAVSPEPPRDPVAQGGDDVVAILTGKLEFHRSQAARIEKALEALREE